MKFISTTVIILMMLISYIINCIKNILFSFKIKKWGEFSWVHYIMNGKDTPLFKDNVLETFSDVYNANDDSTFYFYF